MQKMVATVKVFDRSKWYRIAFIVLFAVAGTLLLTLSRAAANVTTIKSGKWSDPKTWSSNSVPATGDNVTITNGHDVLYDITSSRVSGVAINGTLTFDPSKSTTLETDKNVVVKGQLVMVPATPTVNQALRFVNVNESAFVGGGMDVLASDVGLWVMENGQLYTKGTKRSGWLHTTNGINQGGTQLTLEKAPTGWRVGDKIVISPTDYGQGYDHFHETTISAISGTTVTFANAAPRNYPKVNNKWTPEVMNMTRNVMIEGTASGKSHIFVRSSKPQFVRYAAIQHMGPRAHTSSDQTGRYGLHFHMAGNGSSGSIVEGTLVTKTTNHAFVPHSSNDVTFRDTITYDTFEDPYWWDPGEKTQNALYDHTIAAKSDWFGKGGAKFRNSGYFLPGGDGNEVRDSVAVATGRADGGGYFWDNGSDGLWVFDGNTAHNNNGNGVAVWQNTTTPHTLTDFSIYHNAGSGLDHGAYTNNYLFKDGFIYGNSSGSGDQISLHAVSRQVGMHFINVEVDSANRTDYGVYGCGGAVPGSEVRPVVFSDSVIKNHKKAGYYLHGTSVVCTIELVRTTVGGNQYSFGSNPTSDAAAGSFIRYQNGSDIYKVTYPNQNQGSLVSAWNARKQTIPAFAPDAWGTGTGLKVSYFDGVSLSDLKAVEVRPYLDLESWNEKPPHGNQTSDDTSIRIEGEIEPLFTGSHKIILSNSDGARLWLNDQLVINDWQDGALRSRSATINMQRGQRYKIKAEYFENDVPTTAQIAKGSARLLWQPPGKPEAVIPAPQLYPPQPLPNFDPAIAPDPPLPPYVTGGVPDPEPPADTTAPSVSITSPANNATVSGTINVEASASDNVGVTKVEFYLDNALKSTDSSSPYTNSFNTTSVSNGQHTLSSKAYDAAGNVKTSSTVTVNVNNVTAPPPDTTAPTINITAPANNASVSGTVNVTASASDNVGVTKVEFYVDGSLKSTDSSPPYAYSFNTTGVSNGQHSLSAKAYDATGNVKTSSAVTVNVSNAAPQPTFKPEDINQDGLVNLLDFSILASKFGQTSNLGRADINGDGKVNLIDFSMLAGKFGK